MDFKPQLPPDVTVPNLNGPNFTVDNLAKLGAGHYLQLLGSMGLTAGASYIFGYLTSKGWEANAATLVTFAVCGLIVSAVWSIKARIKLLNTPAPSQSVTISVGPPIDASTNPVATGIHMPPRTSSNAGKTFTALLLVCLVGVGTGCATSESFKAGMRVAGPMLADEATAYTNGDGTLNVLDHGIQTAQADRLKSETSGECEYVEVKTAWLDVKPWYLVYVRQDQRLTDAERAIVLKTVDQVDGLIAEEGKRRRLLFLSE